MTPLRILLVAHNAGLFGAERSTLALAEGLQQHAGFEVMLALPNDGPLTQACAQRGLRYCVSRHRQWVDLDGRTLAGVLRRGLRNLLASLRCPASIRAFDPDVIYTATSTTPYGALLARHLRRPHVWHLREQVTAQFGARYDWGAGNCLRYLSRHADYLVANSRATAEAFTGALQRRDISVIYNGFDFERAPRWDGAQKYQRCVNQADPINLLLLGALVPAKGQAQAIRACALLSARGRRLRLLLAGDGNSAYRSRLQALASELDCSHRVLFPGFADDPWPLYDDAALTLVCATQEAFGRTAVESLSVGTPVIGTDAGGLTEIVAPDNLGRLYPPGDSRALADAIEALLDDPAAYQQIATSAPAHMRRLFSLQRYVSDFTRLFEQAAAQGTRSGLRSGVAVSSRGSV